MKRNLVILFLMISTILIAQEVGQLMRGFDINGNSRSVRTDENGYLMGKIVGCDKSGDISGIDAVTESLQIIDYEHHEIHAGSEFRASFQKDIPMGQVLAFSVTTPNTTKWLHFKLEVDVEVEAEVALYENPSSVSSGTSVLPKNANRNSINSSIASCSAEPTYTIGSATIIAVDVVGSKRDVGGESAAANEWILKQNTKYLIVVTNQSGTSNECNIRCRWYEHTNKN